MLKPYRICILFIMAVVCAGALVYISTGTLFFVSLAGAIEDDERSEGVDSLIKLGVVRAAELSETSGIARSHVYPNAFWLHNDSGHSPALYLVRNDGTLLAKCRVTGGQNADWEDVAMFQVDGISYLAVGDVGDNRGRRQNVAIYLIKEPSLDLVDGKVVEQPVDISQKIIAVYEDGPRNCEALGIDAVEQELYLIEKKPLGRSRNRPGIYRLDLAPFFDAARSDQRKGVHTLRRIADFPTRNVTGMAFSGDSQQVIIRDYLAAHRMVRKPDESWQDRFRRGQATLVPLPIERQGESICFEASGNAVITTSEFPSQPIWQVELKKISSADASPPQSSEEKRQNRRDR